MIIHNYFMQSALFMYDYYSSLLPFVFNNFWKAYTFGSGDYILWKGGSYRGGGYTFDSGVLILWVPTSTNLVVPLK